MLQETAQKMTDNTYDLVVIGGGISGLGFAHLANRAGRKTLLLEASNQPGGCIRSHQFHTPEGDYWTELGAHTCYNSYGNLLQMLEDTHQLDKLQAKEKLRYQIHTPDGLKSIPSQLSFMELLGVLPRLWKSQKDGRSVGDYYAGIIGKKNFENVLGPALDAVVCQPAGEFPADALFRKKPRRKEILRSYTGATGLQSFINKIAEQSGMHIRTAALVTEIQPADGGFRVFVEGAESIQAAHVAIATAPDVARRLLQTASPQLSQILSGIQMTEIESMAVLLKAGSVSLPAVAGIIGRNEAFYSVLSRDLVSDPNYRAFTFHFRPQQLDEDAKLNLICQVLEVQPAAILERVEMSNRLPALRLNHSQLMQQIDEQLAGTGVALTGNWFTGVSIEDSLVRTAQEFARLFPA